jgi:hypothetical protein
MSPNFENANDVAACGQELLAIAGALHTDSAAALSTPMAKV